VVCPIPFAHSLDRGFDYEFSQDWCLASLVRDLYHNRLVKCVSLRHDDYGQQLYLRFGD
jgi:hypothetical protein